MPSNQILEQVLRQLLADGVISEEELEKKAPQVAADLVKQAATAMRRDLLRQAPAALRASRRDIHGFEKRNLQRWRKAFNLIEVLWHVAGCRPECGWNSVGAFSGHMKVSFQAARSIG